jgi:hypothetical protein
MLQQKPVFLAFQKNEFFCTRRKAEMARQLFHGADGGKILFTLNSGTLIPDSQGEIYFDETSYGNCFVHGADSARKASFVLKVEVELDGLHYYRAQKPGNPTTLVAKTNSPLSVRVLEMFVRAGTRDEGFEFEHIVGEEKIRLRLQ